MASHATALTHAWPRWAPLAVFAVGCALATAGLHLVQAMVGPDPALIGLYRFGPALGVGLLFLVFAGHHHRPQLATDQSFTWRTPVMAVVSIAIGAAIVVIAMAAHEVLTGNRVLILDSAHPLALLIAVQLIGALGEETAWRAYLQPELEQWWRPLPAAISVGLIWGIWQSLVVHPPLGQAIVFTISTIALSVVLRGALRFTRGNYLLVATLFRATV
ncbi:MAG: CPBP family intramembrane metalloprotease, partial [Propionibacteriales bacterium]|nr:CPBP family intramembrane metalloprotease [Propionibacteriales bacterium]